MSIRDRGKGARPLPRDNHDPQYFRSDAVCCIAPVVYRDLVSSFSPAMFSTRMLTACCGRKRYRRLKIIAVLIEVEPPWTSAVTIALPARRPACMSVGERRHPTSSVVRRDSARVRAQALSERMEAPAGWRFSHPCHMPGGPGLIQPAGLARPQPGLMVFKEIIRYSPRRRALPCLAEGFSPTASAG